MQDRIPVNPGRVLISPENGAPYYATMTRADNATQEGTPLNKNSLLKDATAALFGFGAYAVPDDVFGACAEFQKAFVNKYVWAKNAIGNTDVLVKATTETTFGSYSSRVTAYTTISLKNGVISLSNPVENMLDYLNGNYIQYNGHTYCISGYESIGNSKFALKGYEMTIGQETRYGTIGYVTSDDPNAYPVDDGYTYTALGQLGNKVQIATGSYTGTGTYGASNPNSLTFDFDPKIIFVFNRSEGYSGQNGIIWASDLTSSYAPRGYSYHYLDAQNDCKAKKENNTVSWYGNGTEQQMNTNGAKYGYLTIG